MKVSQTTEDAVVDAMQRLSCAHLEPEQLHQAVIGQVQRLIPIDGYCAHDLDPASGLPMRLYFNVPDDRPVRDLVAMLVFGESSPDPQSLATSGHLVQRLSETAGGQLDRSFRYREVLAPQGFGYDVQCVYAWRGQAWGGVSMLRARGQHDFSDDAVALLGRLVPHIASGLRASLLREAAYDDPRATSKSPGVIVLDHVGRVTSFTLAAEHWLSQLEALRPDWHEQAALPTAVWMAVATLRRIMRPQTERDRLLTPTIQARGRSGAWIQIQASLALPCNGHDGDTIIVIGPAAPQTVQWLRTSAYELSPREVEIVELIARGFTTRQIANRLFISDYTVQDHLKHIFEKVGVHNRRALVERLYLASF